MDKKLVFRLCWIIWISTIFILSFLPGDKLPIIEWDLISIDKLVHFCLYFILAVFLLLDFQNKKMNPFSLRVYLILILVAITIGFFVELIQGFFVYRRYFDTNDILANSFGTIFGSIIYGWIGRKLV